MEREVFVNEIEELQYFAMENKGLLIKTWLKILIFYLDLWFLYTVCMAASGYHHIITFFAIVQILMQALFVWCYFYRDLYYLKYNVYLNFSCFSLWLSDFPRIALNISYTYFFVEASHSFQWWKLIKLILAIFVFIYMIYDIFKNDFRQIFKLKLIFRIVIVVGAIYKLFFQFVFIILLYDNFYKTNCACLINRNVMGY